MRHPHQTDQIYPAWIQGVSKEPSRQLCFRTASLLELPGEIKKSQQNKEKVDNVSQIIKRQNLCLSKDIYFIVMKASLKHWLSVLFQLCEPRGQYPLKTMLQQIQAYKSKIKSLGFLF